MRLDFTFAQPLGRGGAIAALRIVWQPTSSGAAWR